jgi:L-arabinonolactonase
MNYRIECVVANGDHLGEGPIWDTTDGALYWVNGTGRRVGQPSIWRFDPKTGRTRHWSLNHDIGALALRATGGAVLALANGFYFFDFDSHSLDPIKEIDVHQGRTRLNDGKCDRRGRFFAGGMDDREELAECGLWRLDPDLTVTKIDGNIICSNGPCWSPDDRVFYFADTFQHVMWAYDYDIDTGKVSNRRELVSSRQDRGLFDGSTVDAEGYIWNAQVIGGELVRYSPDGEEDMRIGMPVRNITSLCFGGENLQDLYVTSMGRVAHPAVHQHFRRDVRPQYAAGSLFRVSGLGITGLPEPRFAG